MVALTTFRSWRLDRAARLFRRASASRRLACFPSARARPFRIHATAIFHPNPTEGRRCRGACRKHERGMGPTCDSTSIFCRLPRPIPANGSTRGKPGSGRESSFHTLCVWMRCTPTPVLKRVVPACLPTGARRRTDGVRHQKIDVCEQQTRIGQSRGARQPATPPQPGPKIGRRPRSGRNAKWFISFASRRGIARPVANQRSALVAV
jgi:hypothetical protein